MNKQEKLIVLCVSIACIIFLVVGFYFSNADQFYSGAYGPIVERANQNKKALDDYRKEHGDESDQPRASGLRENEIEKHKGDRYSTY